MVIGAILKSLWRGTKKLVGLAYHVGWRVPKDIRGWRWTGAFWVFVVLAGLILLTAMGHGVSLLVPLFAGLAFLVMRLEDKKPKKLGRPLPYRRRR